VGDCVNAVSAHPSMPLLTTSTGQRSFNLDISDSDSDNDFDSGCPAGSMHMALECLTNQKEKRNNQSNGSGLQLWKTFLS
jgi:hypothetical protein